MWSMGYYLPLLLLMSWWQQVARALGGFKGRGYACEGCAFQDSPLFLFDFLVQEVVWEHYFNSFGVGFLQGGRHMIGACFCVLMTMS